MRVSLRVRLAATARIVKLLRADAAAWPADSDAQVARFVLADLIERTAKENT